MRALEDWEIELRFPRLTSPTVPQTEKERAEYVEELKELRRLIRKSI